MEELNIIEGCGKCATIYEQKIKCKINEVWGK